MSPKVPHEHKEQRQREILNASQKVFAKKGYEATSIKDIMDATSISRGGIYAYFSNKEHIFLSLLEQIMEDNRKEIDEILQQKGSAWETMLSILDDYRNPSNYESEERFSAAIMEYGLTHWRKPENKDYIAMRYRTGTALFNDLLIKGVDSGEFTPIVPSVEISRFLISFFDGLAISAIPISYEQIHVKEQINLLETTLRFMLNIQQKPETSQR